MVGYYCERCDRWFRSSNAIEQHLRDSPFHNNCDKCDYDGACWSSLLDHSRSTLHGWACRDCNDGSGALYPPRCQDWYDHVDKYNVCVSCELHFPDESRLRCHRKVYHDESSSVSSSEHNEYDCRGCSRDFFSVSGKMMHMESGACNIIADIYDVNYYAAKCRTWRNYVYEQASIRMLNRKNTWGDLPYFCQCCDARFERVSALIQHAEKSGCGLRLDRGAISEMLRFIEEKLG